MLTTLQNITTWDTIPDNNIQQKILIEIEIGHLILLPKLNFTLLAKEEKFLTPACADPKAKNISLDPTNKILRGSLCSGNDLIQLQNMLLRFSSQAKQLINSLFPFYTNSLQVGRTSFRPINALGRKNISARKDDTRLHIDSFASQPVHGLRLLRVFSNIHPSLPRVWKLGEPFSEVAKRFLPRISQRQWISPHILKAFKITKSLRTTYDHLMLQMHNAMKEDLNYQNTVPQSEILLPPNSTWIVMTDKVSHAAISGQFMLEQTFYLPVEAMQAPEQSPLRILEKMLGKSLLK